MFRDPVKIRVSAYSEKSYDCKAYDEKRMSNEISADFKSNKPICLECKRLGNCIHADFHKVTCSFVEY